MPKLAFSAALLILTFAVSRGTVPTFERAYGGVFLTNPAGRQVKPLPDPTAKFVAFVFASTNCPISNSYAPEIARLHGEFAPRGVTFWIVYPDADVTQDAIQRHLRDYRYPCAALRDPHQRFALQSRVRVTPEVALYRADGELVYHGRIDNRHVDFGKSRPHATQRDLQDAIEFALEGKPIPEERFSGVGCFIEGAE